MGMFDSIIAYCPKCGRKHYFQSKGGDCILFEYSLDNAPDDVMSDANRHSPVRCDCGSLLEIDIQNRTVIILNKDKV